MRDLENLIKAYDIRGTVPDQLDPALARQIGVAFARWTDAPSIVIVRDMRPSSPGLAAAFADGVTSQGVDVIDALVVVLQAVLFAFLEGFQYRSVAEQIGDACGELGPGAPGAGGVRGLAAEFADAVADGLGGAAVFFLDLAQHADVGGLLFGFWLGVSGWRLRENDSGRG